MPAPKQLDIAQDIGPGKRASVHEQDRSRVVGKPDSSSPSKRD